MILALSIIAGLLMAGLAYWIIFEGWRDFVECVIHPFYYYNWVARDVDESELQELDRESKLKTTCWAFSSELDLALTLASQQYGLVEPQHSA